MFLSRLFKIKDSGELKQKIQDGATLLDVRSKEEYKAGNARGSINIPLDELPKKVGTLNKNSPVVAVCASGARSAQAVRLLKTEGFEAYNGGGWHLF